MSWYAFGREAMKLFGKRADPPTPLPAPEPAPTWLDAPLRSDAPSPGAGTFSITDAYYITGVGSVLVGAVQTGVLRVPCPATLVPGPGSPTARQSIEVLAATVHHKDVLEVRPGTMVGLRSRGIARGGGPHGDVRKGDSLEFQ